MADGVIVPVVPPQVIEGQALPQLFGLIAALHAQLGGAGENDEVGQGVLPHQIAVTLRQFGTAGDFLSGGDVDDGTIVIDVHRSLDHQRAGTGLQGDHITTAPLTLAQIGAVQPLGTGQGKEDFLLNIVQVLHGLVIGVPELLLGLLTPLLHGIGDELVGQIAQRDQTVAGIQRVHAAGQRQQHTAGTDCAHKGSFHEGSSSVWSSRWEIR